MYERPDLDWFKPMHHDRTVLWFWLNRVLEQTKTKFTYMKIVRNRQTLDDIVDKDNLITLPIGWYVVQSQERITAGPKRGRVQFGNIKCWILIRGNRREDVFFFPFDRDVKMSRYPEILA